MEQEYYIGLDIGTSSVGWAVTDMNYQIIKRHGKALWGSRLFASANTAEERRGFRTARRRLDRRNWRINILQELFAEEISKVDSGFYLRMKESKYYPEDKKDSSGKCPELPYALFVDKDYTDKDYHKEYPTIYHLRKMLMETEKVTRRIYEVKGGLFDQQIMKKGKGQIPIKGGDERLKNIYKYGGYNKASGAYFMLVKSLDKKNNEQRTLEFLPIYMKDYVEQSEEKAQEYLVTNRKLKNPEIILPKVKIDTLFKVDGFYMWLSGRTENRLIFKCANQLILSEEDVKILKKVIKFINRKKENKDIVLNEYDGITEEDAGNLYETFIRKLKDSIYKKRLALQGETLENKRKEFEALSLEDKCIVLGEILHLFQCQSGAANLKLIGGPASAGILVMNNNISKCNQISIITQSPTGIFEKEIDLLNL